MNEELLAVSERVRRKNDKNKETIAEILRALAKKGGFPNSYLADVEDWDALLMHTYNSEADAAAVATTLASKIKHLAPFPTAFKLMWSGKEVHANIRDAENKGTSVTVRYDVLIPCSETRSEFCDGSICFWVGGRSAISRSIPVDNDRTPKETVEVRFGTMMRGITAKLLKHPAQRKPVSRTVPVKAGFMRWDEDE